MSDTAELLLDVGDERLLTIGSVVDRLRAEFPDISVSKLRYLEEQGLVMPRRTKSGYRLYSQDDFTRLVRVLGMQRDEYLPLKVIRRELERSPASTLPAARQGLRKTDLVARRPAASTRPRRSPSSPAPTPGCWPSSKTTSWCTRGR